MRYEIVCRGSLGEEALELGRSCGAEKLALERSILGKTVPGIPHEDYRVLVTAAALKLARARDAKTPGTQASGPRNPGSQTSGSQTPGSQTPTTLDYARAKATIDAALVTRGIGIVIPKARPGRVTR